MKIEAIIFNISFYSIPQLIYASHVYDIKWIGGNEKKSEYGLPYIEIEKITEKDIDIIIPDFFNINEYSMLNSKKFIRISDICKQQVAREQSEFLAGIIGKKYLLFTKNRDYDSYDFNVHLDGRYLETIHSDIGTAVLDLKLEGLYYCRLAIFKNGTKIKTLTSNTYEYFTDQFKQKFNLLLEGYNNTNIGSVKFFPSITPFYDILFLFNKKTKEYKVISEGGGNTKQLLKDGNILWFSGMLKKNNKLLFAPELIDSIDDSIINGTIGAYFLVLDRGNVIEIANDYFGQEKIFFYEDDLFFACSNRYHYLLINLKKLNINLSLNILNCICNFSNAYVHFGENPISTDLNVNNISFLSLENRFLIYKNGKIEKYNKKIFYDLDLSVQKNINYKDQINIVKNELIDNVTCILERKEFNEIAADLSGGLDSRLVFGILTNLDCKYKVKIRTIKYPSELDLNIATTITDDFKFDYTFDLEQYFSLSSSSMKYSLKEILDILDSIHLGIYFGKSELISPRTRCDNLLELWGVIGEAVTRPYLTGSKIEFWKTEKNDQKILKEYLEELQRWMISDYDNAGYLLETSMLNEMQRFNLPCSAHKLEILYLLYRNRFHCDIGLFRGYRVLEWTPLQSIQSFKLFHSTFEQFLSNKYAFDLLYTLNDKLVDYEYSSDKYNIEQIKKLTIYKSQNKRKIYNNSKRYNLQKDNFKKRNKNNKINFNYLEYININDINIYLFQRMMPYFKIVMEYQNGIFKNAFGNSIWYICKQVIDGNRDQLVIQKFINIYKKIMSLGNEILIISE